MLESRFHLFPIGFVVVPITPCSNTTAEARLRGLPRAKRGCSFCDARRNTRARGRLGGYQASFRTSISSARAKMVAYANFDHCQKGYQPHEFYHHTSFPAKFQFRILLRLSHCHVLSTAVIIPLVLSDSPYLRFRMSVSPFSLQAR